MNKYAKLFIKWIGLSFIILMLTLLHSLLHETSYNLHISLFNELKNKKDSIFGLILNSNKSKTEINDDLV